MRPVLRRHLLQLQHGSILVRPLLRTDLLAWRRHHHQLEHGLSHPADFDAEAWFLAGVQRSQLQYDNDRLLLGTFDAQGTLLDQLHVRLDCAHARSAELQWLHPLGCVQQRQLHASLLALCPFLFEQVGLRRVYAMLAPDASSPVVAALQSVGFKQEGVLRDHYLDQTGWQDRRLHALTAPDWLAHPACQR
ncbi:MAG: GNAT family protein [Stenotrophomonas sp.]